jgi:predicted SAM-dependent methyltransferase
MYWERFFMATMNDFRRKLESPVALPRIAMNRLRALARAFVGSRQLKRAVRSGNPLRIVVGSGGIGQAGWIMTDRDFLDLLRLRDWQAFFKENSISAILAEHVWEHLTLAEGLAAAVICYNYLTPGGRLRIAVPDGFHPDPDYIELVRVGGRGAGAVDHKVLYNHDTLVSLLARAGFEVKPLEYFDAAGNLHTTDWSPDDGLVRRSRRFDPRNHDGRLRYTSLIVDARKPSG